jgi:hypothetical protein
MPFLDESFTATGTGTENTFGNRFSISVSGGVGTVQLQRFTGGGWQPVKEYTIPEATAGDNQEEAETAGPDRWRFECTAYTSGTINCIADGSGVSG